MGRKLRNPEVFWAVIYRAKIKGRAKIKDKKKEKKLGQDVVYITYHTTYNKQTKKNNKKYPQIYTKQIMNVRWQLNSYISPCWISHTV